MSLQFDNSSFEAKMKEIGRRIVTQVAEPAVSATASTLVQASKNIVPVQTGRLQSSISKSVESNAGGAEGSVFSDVEYAPTVHEDLTAKRVSGEAKFIERPLRNIGPDELKRQLVNHFKGL